MTDEYRPLKNAFGRFATGIAIAACRGDDGAYTALTVNSFTSVSLNPAQVLWCVEYRASAFPVFMASNHYSISILRSDQREMSERFARYQPKILSPAEIEVWETGAPILKERLAGFDCTVVARHKAGDHVILVGEVKKFDSKDGEPLIYYGSAYKEGFSTP